MVRDRVFAARRLPVQAYLDRLLHTVHFLHWSIPNLRPAITDGVARNLPVVAFPSRTFLVASLFGGSHWLLAEARNTIVALYEKFTGATATGSVRGGQVTPSASQPPQADGGGTAAAGGGGRSRRPSLKSL